MYKSYLAATTKIMAAHDADKIKVNSKEAFEAIERLTVESRKLVNSLDELINAHEACENAQEVLDCAKMSLEVVSNDVDAFERSIAALCEKF